MKQIALTQGKIALVDDEDFEALSQYKWHALKSDSNKSFYAIRNSRPSVNGKRSHIFMHRVILEIPDGLDGDHINHDTLDNRRSNLRVATRQQNAFNRRIRSDSRTGLKCVQYRKGRSGRDRWMAYAYIDGKVRSLGTFAWPWLASRVAQKAAMYLHGNFVYSGVSSLIN